MCDNVAPEVIAVCAAADVCDNATGAQAVVANVRENVAPEVIGIGAAADVCDNAAGAPGGRLLNGLLLFLDDDV